VHGCRVEFILERAMFEKFVLSILFMALVISGQIASPSPNDSSAGACAAAQMGILTDETFTVVDVFDRTAAEVAGVQVGDVLLDLTLVSIGEELVCNDTIQPEKTPPTVQPVRPPRDTSRYPTGSVQFSELEAIHTLIDYGLTLKLRVQRNGETIDLMIEPGNHLQVTPGAPTPTAVPATAIFYVY
jgi:hypothetical protein